jgi:hypothetical protein
MSYFQARFSNAPANMPDARQTQNFINNLQKQEQERKERAKALSEDQKRLSLLAQGYGLEKGEADAMSRGELSGFVENQAMQIAQKKAQQEQILNLAKFQNQLQQTDINRQLAQSQLQFAQANQRQINANMLSELNERKRMIQDAQAIRQGVSSGNMPNFSKFLPQQTANAMSDQGVIDAYQKFGARNPNPFANMSPMQEAMDTEAGKSFATYNPNIAKTNITKLERAIGQIEKAIATGENIAGTAKSFLPDIMQDALNKGGKALREAVESVIQLNLRQTLGAQFTQKEGELFMSRGYNPRGTDKENLNKIRVLLKQIKASADLEAQRYEYGTTHGTMQGFVPSMPPGGNVNATQPALKTTNGNPFSSTPLGKIVK